MIVKVVGYQKLDYLSRRRQKQVTGVSLHFVREPMNEDNFVGLVAGSEWLPQKLVDSVGFIPAVNSNINLIYDFDGRNNVLVGYDVLNKE